jgi:hypothetical protein
VNTEQPVIEAQPYPVVAQGHSKIGMASLILSLGTVLLYCLVFVLLIAMVGNEAATFQNQDPNVIAEQLQSGELNDIMIPVVLFVACFFSSPIISLVALGLGIGGLFQKDKSKVFPILGTVLSGVLLCGSGGFVLLALISAMGGQ